MMLAAHPAEPTCAHNVKPGEAARVVRARHEARRLTDQEGLAHPGSAFRVHRVKAIRGSTFDMGEACLPLPAFSELEGVSSLASAACTIGAALEERVSDLFRSREPLLAMALDDLGTQLLFRLSDRLYARIRREARRQGLQAGEAQSPGDEGLSIDAQPAVLALAGIDPQVVSANSRGMLRPVKSLSFVVALGPHLPARSLPPRCLRCASRETCRVRPR